MKLRLPKRKAVYVFHVTADLFGVPLWVAKCGHADNEEQRARDIEESIYQVHGKRVRLRKFIAVRLFLYRAAEKAVHNTLRPLRTRMFEGASGWTEFFREVNFYCALLAYIGLYTFDIPGAVPYSMAVALIPRPLDMAVMVLTLFAIEWAFILLTGWLVYCTAIATINLIL